MNEQANIFGEDLDDRTDVLQREAGLPEQVQFFEDPDNEESDLGGLDEEQDSSPDDDIDEDDECPEDEDEDADDDEDNSDA